MEKTLTSMGSSIRKKFPFLHARLLELKLSISDDLNDQKHFQNNEDFLSPITLKFSSNMVTSTFVKISTISLLLFNITSFTDKLFYSIEPENHEGKST